MSVIRNSLGVVIGYLIFAISALALFRIGDIDPHLDASLGAKSTIIVFGAVFAFCGGYAAKLIASTRTLYVNIVLACVMAGFATVSLVSTTGSHYTQIAAVVLFAPISLIGGYLRRRSEIRI